MADNETIRKEKAEAEKNYTSEIRQLKEMNLKNDEIIAGQSEKIDTLSGLVNKYKGYAEENEILKKESFETQRVVEKLQQDNEKLNTLLAEKEKRIKNMQDGHAAWLDEMTQKHSEDMERKTKSLSLKGVVRCFEQRERYNRELDEARDMYQEKINQLLQISSKPKR
jgi:flagellar biosynthesis/type III secretory pathway chaperone